MHQEPSGVWIDMAYTTIDDPSAHFKTVLWAGDDADPRTITFGGNSDLQPDLVITKSRNDTNSWHTVDTSRGTTNASAVALDRTEVEGGLTNGNTQLYGYISAITSNGFTVVDGSNTTSYNYNKSGTNFVGYGWKANGGTTATLDAGSLNTTGQANTTAGFSILTYTGTGDVATIAHGLGAVPHFILVKARTNEAIDWAVYHHKNTAAPETDYLVLNTTAATADDINFWRDTAPTSTLISIGARENVNSSTSHTYVAYCFTEIQGYSKFGSYTGNGNADGTFVYTGFKPAWLLIKQSSASGENWRLFDSARSTFNQVNKHLVPSTYGAESAETGCDFLSNGFKLRDADAHQNSATTYIYMAFAEQPFVTSSGVPATAR